MGQLFDTIKLAISENRYVLGFHAEERLEERGIMEWQVIAGMASCKLLRERPRGRPNSVVEVESELPDGTMIKSVWAWLPHPQHAKLVTVHFFDE